MKNNGPGKILFVILQFLSKRPRGSQIEDDFAFHPGQFFYGRGKKMEKMFFPISQSKAPLAMPSDNMFLPD